MTIDLTQYPLMVAAANAAQGADQKLAEAALAECPARTAGSMDKLEEVRDQLVRDQYDVPAATTLRDWRQLAERMKDADGVVRWAPKVGMNALREALSAGLSPDELRSNPNALPEMRLAKRAALKAEMEKREADNLAKAVELAQLRKEKEAAVRESNRVAAEKQATERAERQAAAMLNAPAPVAQMPKQSSVPVRQMNAEPMGTYAQSVAVKTKPAALTLEQQNELNAQQAQARQDGRRRTMRSELNALVAACAAEDLDWLLEELASAAAKLAEK